MKLIKSFVPHSRCFGSYFDVIFLMYLVSSGFSFKPTSSSSSSSSTQFSQEWACRKVVVKHSIKSIKSIVFCVRVFLLGIHICLQLFIVEHSGLLPKCLAFLYLGQSRWEDKVTATKIRGSSTSQEGLREWINDTNVHCYFVCEHGDMWLIPNYRVTSARHVGSSRWLVTSARHVHLCLTNKLEGVPT